MKIPWASGPKGSRARCLAMSGLRKAGLGHQATGDPMVNHYLHFRPIVGGGNPSFSGAACDPFQRSWPACLFWRGRQRGPTAEFSLLPTSPTATGSTSASPRARSAALMPPGPIVSRGILRRPLRTAGSIRTKSPARFRRKAQIAAVRAAANTSRSPASAESATRPVPGPPQWCRGNDVTSPREAGKARPELSHLRLRPQPLAQPKARPEFPDGGKCLRN